MSAPLVVLVVVAWCWWALGWALGLEDPAALKADVCGVIMFAVFTPSTNDNYTSTLLLHVRGAARSLAAADGIGFHYSLRACDLVAL